MKKYLIFFLLLLCSACGKYEEGSMNVCYKHCVEREWNKYSSEFYNSSTNFMEQIELYCRIQITDAKCFISPGMSSSLRSNR